MKCVPTQSSSISAVQCLIVILHFFQPCSDRRGIEMTVAEKPLNENHKDSSLEMSPKDNHASAKEENLKLTIKASR